MDQWLASMITEMWFVAKQNKLSLFMLTVSLKVRKKFLYFLKQVPKGKLNDWTVIQWISKIETRLYFYYEKLFQRPGCFKTGVQSVYLACSKMLFLERRVLSQTLKDNLWSLIGDHVTLCFCRVVVKTIGKQCKWHVATSSLGWLVNYWVLKRF